VDEIIVIRIYRTIHEYFISKYFKASSNTTFIRKSDYFSAFKNIQDV